jgi:outer membrane protein TolC
MKKFKHSTSTLVAVIISQAVLFILMSKTVIAKPVNIDQGFTETIPVKTNTSLWAKWVLSQVLSLPSIKAIEKGKIVASEQLNAMHQPVYNPELGAFYTDKTDEEYGFMISQTIDLFDRRTANAQLAQVDYDLATLKKIMFIEKKLSEALFAYIDFSVSKKRVSISKSQEKILIKLSAALSLREAVGDVSQIDAEMAYLSLSQNLQQISLTEIHYRKALSNLQKTFNNSEVPIQPEPSIWIKNITDGNVQMKLENSFKIQYAKKQLEESISQSKIAQLNKKVDPTIAFGAGRDGDENTILLEISVPLNIRNNFSSKYNASLHKVNQAEFELKEEQRLLKNDIEQSLENFKQLKSRVLHWQKLTGKRLKNSQKLLNRQWKSGDISTSDYLFSLRQRTDTLVANIEMTGEMHKAWVEWLLASSQVQQWLKSLSLSK